MSNLYNSGIQGYTLKGDIGERGQHSYNIFYSIYDCNNKEGLDTVERLINEGKSLSKDNVDGIIYNEHDTILDVKAHMYECKLDPSENKLKISYVFTRLRFVHFVCSKFYSVQCAHYTFLT